MIALLLACATTPQVEPSSNRLAQSSSSYLRQHADNPVDWYPWGEEAFQAARARDVPIFLSIGYSACHWCHVMERESFQDPATAAYLDEHFVSIKVDREQLPQVDALYMDAVNILAGSGGWPASLWLDHEGRPFEAGTYFPPEPTYGKRSFRQVLEGVVGDWEQDRPAVDERATQVQRALESVASPPAAEPVTSPRVQAALDGMAMEWDRAEAGWGNGSKFPLAPRLELLLEAPEGRALLLQLLHRMERSGLHDHLGGGFHRYTVDRAWELPHFEKMLYDNAQLLPLYAEAGLLFDEPRFASAAEGIAGHMLGELPGQGGALVSSLSAESEGLEGRFYAWTPDELEEALGSEAQAFARAYSVDEGGEVEGASVLVRREAVDPQDFVEARARLAEARGERVAPERDEQQVVAWNGLAVGGLARAGLAMDRPEWIEAASGLASSLLALEEEGRLPRTFAADSPPGSLADHALVAEGLLDLYLADPQPRWLLGAERIAAAMLEDFSAPGGGLYGSAHLELLVREQELQDASEPSAYGRALLVLTRLQGLGSPVVPPGRVQAGLDAGAAWLEKAPGAAPSLVRAHQLALSPGRQVVLLGPQPEPFLEAATLADRRGAAWLIVGSGQRAELAHLGLLEGKLEATDGATTAYVCVNGACQLPTTQVELFVEQLEALR